VEISRSEHPILVWDPPLDYHCLIGVVMIAMLIGIEKKKLPKIQGASLFGGSPFHDNII
jgi:hypothetical protein